MMAHIGFIGLGNMGTPMAINLLKGHHAVTGFDVFPKGMEALHSAGGAVGKSIAAIAADSEIVITMLPSGKEVREVYLGA
jgi:3-hydroxyisobutyrate dehydrogenase